MKKTLILLLTGFEPYGGLSSVMMNYYRNMDKSDLSIDFASTNALDEALLLELSESGSTYYDLGQRKKAPLRYYLNLYKLLKRNRYDVIHVNGNSRSMAVELTIAKLCGVKKRIAHGHNERSSHPVIHRLLGPLFKRSYTDALCASEPSGKWLYGSGYTVLNNAIDTTRYRFDPFVREWQRRELNIPPDCVVVGTVGKLNYQKNPAKILSIFQKYHQANAKSKLLLVGGGPLMASLQAAAKSMDIEDTVFFAGMQNSAAPYLQAMDVFLFASRYEGKSLALLEAQASGLYCLVPDHLSDENKHTTDLISLYNLNDDESEQVDWLDLHTSPEGRVERSRSACAQISACGYSIRGKANELRKIYLS